MSGHSLAQPRCPNSMPPGPGPARPTQRSCLHAGPALSPAQPRPSLSYAHTSHQPNQLIPVSPYSSQPSGLQHLPIHRQYWIPSLVQALWGTEMRETHPTQACPVCLPGPSACSCLLVLPQSLVPGTFLPQALCTCWFPPPELPSPALHTTGLHPF